MKILFLSTSDSNGGAAIACRRLMEAVNKQEGMEAKMLVQEKKTSDERIFSLGDSLWSKTKKWLRFVIERLAFLPNEKDKAIRYLFNPAVIGVDLASHPLVKNADVLHIHWVNFGFLSVAGLKALMSLNKPVVWTFHDMWAFTGGCHHSGECEGYQSECGNCKFMKSPQENDLSHQRWKAKKQAYSSLFVGVSCSQWLTNRAQKSLLLRSNRLLTIPNPLNLEVFHPVNKQQARVTFNLTPEKEYILFAAMRVTALNKGFNHFKEAVELLNKHHPEWQDRVELLVMGHGDQLDWSDVPYPIRTLGYLSDTSQIINAYSAASMFVTPSLEENLPNTIMEAMACGTPSVGFEIGGIPEMIDSKVNGYLATYKSSESLADGIHWILSNSESVDLPHAARKKVEHYYEEGVVAKQYVQIYNSFV